jgi:hypothetical protein
MIVVMGIFFWFLYELQRVYGFFPYSSEGLKYAVEEMTEMKLVVWNRN